MKRLFYGIAVFLCLACMFLIWPVGVIRTSVSGHNGSDGRINLELGADTLTAEQYFVPTFNYVKSISFAVSYEDFMDAENVFLLFTVSDEDGNILFSSEEPLSEFVKNSFYDVEVDLRLTAGKEYCWKVSLAADAPAGTEVGLLCTDPGIMTPGENRFFYYSGELSERVSVVKYTYAILPGKIHILVYDVFIVCIFLLAVLGLKKINKH